MVTKVKGGVLLYSLFRCGVGVLLLSFFFETSEAKIEKEEWQAIYLQGNHIGFALLRIEVVELDGVQIFCTTTEQEMKVKRLGHEIAMSERRKVYEDDAGKVLRFEIESSSSAAIVKTQGRVEGDQVFIVMQGQEVSHDYPENALGPRALDHLSENGFKDGREVVAYGFNPLDPARAFEWKQTKPGKQETKVVLEQEVSLVPLELSTSHMPGMGITAWFNDEVDLLLMETEMGGLGKMEWIKTTKDFAMHRVEAKELFVKSLVTPNRAISDVRKIKQGVYRLKLTGKDKAQDVSLSKDDRQTWEIAGERTIKVKVSLPKLPEEDRIYTELPIKDGVGKEYLEPTTFIQSDDPRVVQLAQEIQGSETNALVLAKKIEKAVHLKIREKNFGMGFASAAEVAERLEGDCTEHAVLAAAIARAIGLPSRVVTGLAYVSAMQNLGSVSNSSKGLFGFHMWAEVLVAPDCWWPVDGALEAFTASHIAISKTALEQLSPEMELSLPILKLVGQLEIDVISTE